MATYENVEPVSSVCYQIHRYHAFSFGKTQNLSLLSGQGEVCFALRLSANGCDRYAEWIRKEILCCTPCRCRQRCRPPGRE